MSAEPAPFFIEHRIEQVQKTLSQIYPPQYNDNESFLNLLEHLTQIECINNIMKKHKELEMVRNG